MFKITEGDRREKGNYSEPRPLRDADVIPLVSGERAESAE
jgi:hypothetical protein